MTKLAPRPLRALCWAIPLCLGVGAALAEDEAGSFGPIEPMTKAECSACHNVYPAELLPASSWNQIMDTLATHFGEDASLKPEQVAVIRDYLTRNAMPVAAGTDPAGLPLRITDYPWYTRIHGKRMAVQAKADAKIGTLSNCSGCHTGM